MQFLTIEDFKKQIRDDQLMVVIQDDTTLLDSAELSARSEMDTYLNQRYDAAQIFAASGTERNALIVMYLVDMALYQLYSNVNPRKIPQLRTDRYDMAVTWLKNVADGKLSPGLPESTGTADDIRWGSNTVLGHSY